MFVIGIDAGGTKTVCQLADEHANVLAEARGPGANLQAGGELEVEKALHAVMAEALGHDRSIRPSAICCGMAGVDRPEDVAAVRAILTRIGEKADLLIVNDALIALEAGAPGEAGVVIVAGTGSIAYGRDTEGHAARAGGWGHVLGDEGSGYWLGRQALQAVVRASDGRGPRDVPERARPDALRREPRAGSRAPDLLRRGATRGDCPARRARATRG